ncbi:Hypothetical protein BAV1549, partial [Bordetella avium 197N]
VIAPAAPGLRHPRHPVSRLRSDARVPYLVYADTMWLGRILHDCLPGLCMMASLETVYESD